MEEQKENIHTKDLNVQMSKAKEDEKVGERSLAKALFTLQTQINIKHDKAVLLEHQY